MKRLLLLFVLLAFCKNLLSQKDSPLVRIIQDIDSAKTKVGDTIQIRFQNICSKQLAYEFEVLQLGDSGWFENPFYTQYYNHKLSYKKLQEMFSHHLPVIPSKYWTVNIGELKPTQTAKIFFLAKRSENRKTLIKIRINFFSEDGIVGESIIDKIESSPFRFVLIQE